MEERIERVERIERPAAPPPVTPPQADRPPRPRSAPPPQKKARRRGVVVADPIADLLTRLRNGARARHDTVAVAPSSKLKIEVAKILKAEGFIQGYEVQAGTLTCRLRYVGGARISAFSDAQRISRPGRRTYAGRHDLPLIRRGLGVTIVSTSQGLMTGSEATKKGLGGELLCSVW